VRTVLGQAGELEELAEPDGFGGDRDVLHGTSHPCIIPDVGRGPALRSLASADVPDLRSLPKAHLHVHAESTVRPSTLRELAHGLPAPPPRTRFDGFRDFGDHGGLVRACLRSPADFTRVGTELMQDEAAQARDTWRSRSRRGERDGGEPHLGSGMEGGIQESLNRRCGGPPIDPRTRRPVHGLVGRRCERAGRATVAAPGRRPGPRRNSRMTTTTTSTSSSADRTDRVEGVRATCATGSAYLAYPVGARFPRRALAGKSSARVLPRQACSIRACPVGARFPRRTAVELTERIPVSFVGGTASRPPVGARFPRPKRTDDR
jgi:hypothetical protein